MAALALIATSLFAFKTWIDSHPQLQSELVSVYLGASKADVVALKGEPLKETRQGRETLLSFFTNGAFTFVHLTDDVVTKISMGCHEKSTADLNGVVCGDSTARVIRRLGKPSEVLFHRKESMRSYFYRDLQVNLILSNGVVDVLEVLDTDT